MAPAKRPFRIVRVGRVKRNPMRDFYHWMMVIPWWKLSFFILSLFLFSNIFFATLYWCAGDVIRNAAPHSFADRFFFSVQTMSTIGYGHLMPMGMFANLLATFEAMIGLLGFAMASDLRWNARFRDIFREESPGVRLMDFDLFHQTEPFWPA